MIALVALVFLGTFAYLFKRSQPKTVEYQELTPSRGDIVRSTVVTGKIQPRDEVNVKPQINGIIAEMYKEAGETVQQNEVIAKLKVIPDMNQLSSAQSRVRLSEVNLKQAQVNYDREKRLFDQNLVSAESFEKVSQALRQAQEEHSIAKETLEIVRDGVSSSNKSGSTTLIRSTISGLILDVPVKVGNSVINSNTFNDGTTIAVVADMSDMIFKGKIDESEVGKIHEGMNLDLTVGAIVDTHFDATLEYISPKGVEENGAVQFEIKAKVKLRDDQFIRSGYSANADIILDRHDSVMAISEGLLFFENDSSFVNILVSDSTEAEQRFERRNVEIGLSDGINIEIKNGLDWEDKLKGNAAIN